MRLAWLRPIFTIQIVLRTYKIFLLVATINAHVIAIGRMATGHTLIESLLVGTGATAQTGFVAAGGLVDAAIRAFLGANCKKENVNYINQLSISLAYLHFWHLSLFQQ